jgi:hypothetical protein
MNAARSWRVFERVSVGVGRAKWTSSFPTYTWSAGSARRLLEIMDDSRGLHEVHVRAAGPYGHTLTVDESRVTLGERHFVRELGRQLCELSQTAPLVLFTGMLPVGFSLSGLRRLFALVRDDIVAKWGDTRAALVPQIAPATADQSSFPLHSDCYGADRLLNVFGDVPDDGSGAALLLAVDDLASCLKDARVPRGVTSRVLELIKRRAGVEDGFDELMMHLYSRPWSAELADVCAARCIRLVPRPGDGYLLDDTKVVHGREALSTAVSEDRLIRLAFADGSLPEQRMLTSSTLDTSDRLPVKAFAGTSRKAKAAPIRTAS